MTQKGTMTIASIETSSLPQCPGGLDLGANLRRVTSAALQRGALLPIQTSYQLLEEGGVGFIVRVVENLNRKDKARQAALGQGPRQTIKTNPFQPYDQDLFVCQVTETHLCLLNKFNVLDDHLLIVTKDFEEQERLLTRADFEALWACMFEVDGLGFYNGGEIAGASQRHKHLQLVPLPLAPGVEGVPVEPLLDSICNGTDFDTVPAFPFVHAFTGLAEPPDAPLAEAGEVLYDTYLRLMRALDLAREGDPCQRAPYNLLATRRWMLVAPRSRELYQGISVNSLGFAGALLVRNQDQLDLIRRVGPMAVLRHVGVGR